MRILVRISCLFAVALLALGVSSSQGEALSIHHLGWSSAEVGIDRVEGDWVAVTISGGFHHAVPGDPDLPWVVATVPLEQGQQVASWTWNPVSWDLLDDGVRPLPALEDRPTEAGGPRPVDPRPDIYQGTLAYPDQDLLYQGVQSRDGRLEAVFLVCPLRWDPRDGALSLVRQGELEVQLAGAPGGAADIVVPLRPTPFTLGEKGASPGRLLHSVSDGLAVTNVPTLESAPVEFLVVTTEDLAPGFEPLVDWKNRTGYPASIRTINWIQEHYPHGVDLPEMIRLFLRDAYQSWGTRTVLMGGDPSKVPIRYAHSYSWDLPTGRSIATDYYYACLDGNWNADGDEKFGEGLITGYSPVSDQADLRPELKVGRVSVLTLSEAEIWVNKYLSYARNEARLTDAVRNQRVLSSITTLGEVLFDAAWTVGDRDSCGTGDPGTPCVRTDGAVDCFMMVDSVKVSPYGDFFEFDELYEREYIWNPRRGINAQQLNYDNAMASLNDGRNIVFHMGHGDRDRWAIGLGRFLTSDAKSLTNAPFYSGLAYTVNCNSAAVQADCVAESWMTAPDGGGVNYIGSTDLDFPVAARQVQNLFFHRWMADEFMTPGQAYFSAADSFGLRVGEMEVTLRFLLFSLIYLGDPDATVWRDIPAQMTVTAPSSVELGQGPLTVTVALNGQPLSRARVCLYKEGDALAVGETSASGTVSLPFAPSSTGTFLITATHPRGLPHEGQGTVTGSTASFATAAEIILNDTTDEAAGILGNGNGQIETGETVAITLSVANPGGSAAQGLSVSLEIDGEVPDLEVTLLDMEESLADLPAGGTVQAEKAFLIRVDESATPTTENRTVDLPLLMTWEANDGSHEQAKTLRVFRPDLLLIGTTLKELVAVGDPDSLPDAGETLALVTQISNRGNGEWATLRGRLVPSNPAAVDFVDSLATFGWIRPGESARSDTFRFEVNAAFQLSLNFILEDTLDTAAPRRIWNRLLKLTTRPEPPDSLTTFGSPSSIQLSWDDDPRNQGIWGYRVYRSEDPEGPFEPIGSEYVQGMRLFSDEGLAPQTRLYYQVATVDSSGIESEPTEAVVGNSSPGSLAGWPNYISEARDVAPLVEDLNGWGNTEIIVSSDALYAFNADGGDYHDGDGSPSTRGVLVERVLDRSFQSKCASVDLDGDGRMELIAAATTGSAGSWQPSRIIVYDDLGNLKWERSMAFRPVVGSPAVGNIDNDPDYEIVVLVGPDIYAFNHDGTPFTGSTGRIPLTTNADWQYGSVTLADVDQDNRDEIIFTTHPISGDVSARLYVINGVDDFGAVGTPMPGFPISYADFLNTSNDQPSNSSPAVGDVTSKATGLPDGKPDIIVATKSWLWAFDPSASGLEPEDKLVWRVPLQVISRSTNPLTPSPALGDIDGDGDLDIAACGGSGYLYVLDGKAEPALPGRYPHTLPLPGFSESAGEPYRKIGNVLARMGSPILANLDDDPRPEVIVGDNDGYVYALHPNGEMMGGFPYVVPGGRVGVGLAAWDVDRDGRQNLVIQSDKVQQVTILDFPNSVFDPSNAAVTNPWPQFRRDPRNSGYASGDAPIPVQTMAVAASGLGGLQAELRWQTDLSVARFLVHRRAEPGGDWELIAEWDPAEIRDEAGRYRVVDTAPEDGTWSYRIEALDWDGRVSLAGTVTLFLGSAPAEFALHPARPNPFNPRTQIRLDLPQRGACSLEVLDVSGRVVRRLLDGPVGPGVVSMVWDGLDDEGRAVGSGIYFLRAAAPGQGQARQKLVLLK